MKKKDCLFCKIVKGETPSFKIYEDKDFLAILDISQFTEGHTIVIPKKHVEFIWDVRDIKGYFSVIQKIANHFRSLGYKYVDSLTFGRKVPHAHFHLVPHNGEGGDYKNALKNLGALQENPSRRPASELGNKIAKKFKLI